MYTCIVLYMLVYIYCLVCLACCGFGAGHLLRCFVMVTDSGAAGPSHYVEGVGREDVRHTYRLLDATEAGEASSKKSVCVWWGWGGGVHVGGWFIFDVYFSFPSIFCPISDDASIGFVRLSRVCLSPDQAQSRDVPDFTQLWQHHSDLLPVWDQLRRCANRHTWWELSQHTV